MNMYRWFHEITGDLRTEMKGLRWLLIRKQDLEKAIHYCQMAIDRDYPDKPKPKEDKSQDKDNSWGIITK